MRLLSILNEITRPDDYGFAADRLKQAGYTPVGTGAGSFAQVVGKPNSPYVVKLFTSNDRSYLAYLKMIMANPNVHFPKVFGKPYLVKESYFAVRLERLERLDETNMDFVFQDVLPFEANIRHNPNKQYRLDAEHPELAKAIRLIGALLEKNWTWMYADLSAENIMQRGSTLVITDPVN